MLKAPKLGRKAGKDLEESLVLCPAEQQRWFSNRHLFDLVVIYDEESRVNPYVGGPSFDIHQVRLRNLIVAMVDYAGCLKPLKRVPMLLIGGLRAWCQLAKAPLRQVRWDTDTDAGGTSVGVSLDVKRSTNSLPALDGVEHHMDGLDFDAESKWLEPPRSERFPQSFEHAYHVGIVSRVQIVIPIGWTEKT